MYVNAKISFILILILVSISTRSEILDATSLKKKCFTRLVSFPIFIIYIYIINDRWPHTNCIHQLGQSTCYHGVVWHAVSILPSELTKTSSHRVADYVHMILARLLCSIVVQLPVTRYICRAYLLRTLPVVLKLWWTNKTNQKKRNQKNSYLRPRLEKAPVTTMRKRKNIAFMIEHGIYVK